MWEDQYQSAQIKGRGCEVGRRERLEIKLQWRWRLARNRPLSRGTALARWRPHGINTMNASLPMDGLQTRHRSYYCGTGSDIL